MQAQELEACYHKYKHLLFRIAFPYVKNQADAEDILQEVFTRRLCTKQQFADDEHEKRWLIRVTVNLAKDQLKSFWLRNRDSMESVPEGILTALDSGGRQLLQAVLDLPEACKAPIYLHYYEGYSCREIGEMLGCRESAVKMRLKKGRELLKLDLTEEDDT